MRGWRRPNESVSPQYFASKFSNSPLIVLWRSAGPKGSCKLAVYNGLINAQQFVSILFDNFASREKDNAWKGGGAIDLPT